MHRKFLFHILYEYREIISKYFQPEFSPLY